MSNDAYHSVIHIYHNASVHYEVLQAYALRTSKTKTGEEKTLYTIDNIEIQNRPPYKHNEHSIER